MAMFTIEPGGILRSHHKVMMTTDGGGVELGRFPVRYDARIFLEALEERQKPPEITDTSTPEKRMAVFTEELRALINRLGMDNQMNTPDWILTEYMIEQMKLFSVCYLAGQQVVLEMKRMADGGLVVNTKSGLDLPG